jgi:hypothetical protein
MVVEPGKEAHQEARRFWWDVRECFGEMEGSLDSVYAVTRENIRCRRGADVLLAILWACPAGYGYRYNYDGDWLIIWQEK